MKATVKENEMKYFFISYNYAVILLYLLEIRHMTPSSSFFLSPNFCRYASGTCSKCFSTAILTASYSEYSS